MSSLINGLTKKHEELDLLIQKISADETMLRERELKIHQKEEKNLEKEIELKKLEHTQSSQFLKETRSKLENLVRILREGEITREKTLAVKGFITELSKDVEDQTNVISAMEKESEEKKKAIEQEKEIIAPVLKNYGFDIADVAHIHINPTGNFVIGGPNGDTGLTGRKIIVDTYGGYFSHGGGAFSGKDPTKVDRSAAYMARYMAKNLVAAGLATQVQVQLAYAIGVAQPVSLRVESFGTGVISDEKMTQLLRKTCDMTPAGIIRKLELRRPIYASTATIGQPFRGQHRFLIYPDILRMYW